MLAYRTFFLTYGGLHVSAGAAIWLFPALTGFFLNTPAPADAATLMGFLSMLAGLGFCSAAFAQTPVVQRLVIVAGLVGNLLNLLAHFHNTLRGFMAGTTFLATLPVFLILFGLLLVLLRANASRRTYVARTL